MALIFYYVMFAISLLLAVIYAFIFHKHFDTNLTIIAALIPVVNLGFVLMGNATIIEEALVGLRLSYIGGCFLIVATMFLIFNTCGIKMSPWFKMGCILVSSIVFATTLTIGHTELFYKFPLPTLEFAYGAAYIDNKHYGVMHTIFYIMVGAYYLMTIAVVIYSFFKKKQVPINILILISLSITIAVVGFFGSRFITNKIEILPATYNLGMIIYLIIASRLRLYDASDSVIDSLVQKGETGFVSLDNKLRFLDGNETAKKMFPELGNLRVDHSIEDIDLGKNYFSPWIKEFINDNENSKRFIDKDDKTYLVQIHHLLIGRFYRGYQLYIVDDTANQQHIKLIQTYNSQLEEEVAKKTAHVIEMQEKLVLGMATMVEGRDNSTGGHIRRTSDCIKILVEGMQDSGYPGIDETFCKNLIRAAPMHDLGKIAVDDAILRKPGKFTPEEFEIMKTHASEGARIVKQILEGTDDVEFMKMAINVAHYHHERWDGSGYPKGLKGEEIPLEARIMAIADVYDALVSKRVYKERMSFENANNIIMEGMGKHFDKSLEPFYVKARSKLEDYYINIEKNEK